MLHCGDRGPGRAKTKRAPETLRAAPSAAGRGQPPPARGRRSAHPAAAGARWGPGPGFGGGRGQCGGRVLAKVEQSTSCLSFPVCIPPRSGLAEGHEGARAMPGASPAPCPGRGLGSSFSVLSAARGSTRPPSRLPAGAGGTAGCAGENFPAERRRPAARQPALARGGHLETSTERQKESVSAFLTATCNRFFRAKHLCIQEALSQAISLSRGETDGELILAGRALLLPSSPLGLFRERSRAEAGFNPHGCTAPHLRCLPGPCSLPGYRLGWWPNPQAIPSAGLPST